MTDKEKLEQFFQSDFWQDVKKENTGKSSMTQQNILLLGLKKVQEQFM